MRRKRQVQYEDVELQQQSQSELEAYNCPTLGATCIVLIITFILLVIVSVVLGWFVVLYFNSSNDDFSDMCETASCIHLANTILNSVDRFAT